MTRFQLRRWWFRVHQWIGIGLFALLVPVALSGAVLVWHEAFDRALEPQRYMTSGTTPLPPDAYVAAARARLPGTARLATLTYPAGDGPVLLAAARAGAPLRAGPPLRLIVYLDPPTARVLDVASSDTGVVRFIHVLHGSLRLGAWGRTLVGWLGVALLLSCASGLWLWWPTVGRWTRGLRWRRRGDANANLHHLLGFWLALPLAVLALTGCWMAFPRVFAALAGEASRPAPMRAAPAPRTSLTATQAVALAEREVRGPVRVITWPSEAKPDWIVTIGTMTVGVADDAGVAVREAAPAGQGNVARLMRRVHDGDVGGPVWRVLITIAGLAPLLLAVTGVVMWVRGRSGAARKRRFVVERPAAGGL